MHALRGKTGSGLSSRDVKSVMVNGEMVYEDRQFPFDIAPSTLGPRKKPSASGSAWTLWSNCYLVDQFVVHALERFPTEGGTTNLPLKSSRSARMFSFLDMILYWI